MNTTRLHSSKPFRRTAAMLCGLALAAQTASAYPILTNVVETGGDNEATDTITAKWTGVTWNATIAG